MFETIRMVLLGTINTYSKQVIIIRENSLLRTFRILKAGELTWRSLCHGRLELVPISSNRSDPRFH